MSTRSRGEFSHFASTTFCWLPPLRLLTFAMRFGVRMRSRVIHSVATARAFDATKNGPMLTGEGSARKMLSCTLRPCAIPSIRRSAGT